MNAAAIDCIVLLQDPRRLIEFGRSLFSLQGQTHRPLHVIAVTQHFSADAHQQVEAALAPLQALPEAASMEIVEAEKRTGATHSRSDLLNIGIRHARGRYLGFLDCGDTLYPEAYALLVERLQYSEAAIAFASVRALDAELHTTFLHPTGLRQPAPHSPDDVPELLAGASCPLHAHLIDRSKVPAAALRFDPLLHSEANRDLLLRICAHYPSDTAALGTQIGEHYCNHAHTQEHDTQDDEWTSARMQARRVLSPKVI